MTPPVLVIAARWSIWEENGGMQFRGAGNRERRADDIEFRILGPLEVLDGREVLPIGGAKQRALLAVLLLSANEVVPSDRLIDDLWGERLPQSGRAALQVRISQLRKALGRGGERLVTRPPGYVLEIDPEELDLTRFERLVAGSERVEPTRAATMLREALALWRGSPLADISYEAFAQASIRRMEELRLEAIEKRVEADLALGRHVKLVAELEVLVAEHPLNERLLGQLMRALYDCGRQVDALAVYRQAVASLRDELGIDPGPELRELERAILQHESTLDPRARPLGDRSRATSAPEAHLPSAATTFVGRGRELAGLLALLGRAETRLLTLTGPGGSGKTRLALRAAEEAAPDYRDGVWFAGFANVTDPELIIPAIGQALGLAEQPDVAPVQRLAQWLNDRELLLVLDNLEQLVDGTTCLSELVARCPGLTLLTTSREPLHLAGECQYDVPALTQLEAVELFAARARAVAPTIRCEPDLADEICQRLDCLPLAIELAAARAKVLSHSEILSRLESRLPLLTGGPRDAPQRQRTLRAAIDWSYELLDREQRGLFARLAVFAGGCTLAAAETVCAAELDTMQALVDRSLVRREKDRYGMLQTVREYALERLEQSGEADELRRGRADWLIELLRAEGLFQPGWPNERSLARVAPERENFAAALDWAFGGGMFEIVAQLAASLAGVWLVTGRFHEAERWLSVVRDHGDRYPVRLAAEVASAARANAWHRGEHRKSERHAEHALSLWRQVGDREAIGREMLSLANAACDRGDHAAGRVGYERTIGFAREHGLSGVLASALISLADLEIRDGRLEQAIRICEESRALAAPGSDLGAVALINLTHIAMLEDRHADAADLAREALDGALRSGAILAVSWTAIEAAWPLAAEGEFEHAARLLGSATRFLDRTGARKEWMDQVAIAGAYEILHDHLDAPALQALLEEGRKTAPEEVARTVLQQSNALLGRDASTRIKS
ncbi:MAG: BTAD domain-containing putative transcriptional regulator [Solirubrobacteraceae bacterium]